MKRIFDSWNTARPNHTDQVPAVDTGQNQESSTAAAQTVASSQQVHSAAGSAVPLLMPHLQGGIECSPAAGGGKAELPAVLEEELHLGDAAADGAASASRLCEPAGERVPTDRTAASPPSPP